VGIAEIDVSILLTSASTPIDSSELVVTPRMSSNLFCKLLAVASLIFWQWEQPSLAVGTYTASGNSILAVAMPCAFYSQHGVHHVTSKDKEIFMLVEKDYPLRKGLAIGMISIPTSSDEFPLPEQLPTANEDKFPLLIQSDATVKKIALLLKSRNNYHLGKFNGKDDEGFFVGYSLNSKAFRVFNSRTRIVEENLHLRFSESTPNVKGSGLDWLFDIDALIRKMNYEPIIAGTQSNGFAGTKASDNAGQARKEIPPVKDYILLPLWTADPSFSQDLKSSNDDRSKPSSDDEKKVDEDPRKENECNDQEKEDNVNSTNNVNTAGNVNIVSSTVNDAGTNEVNVVGRNIRIELQFDPNMPALEDVSTFDFLNDDKDVVFRNKKDERGIVIRNKVRLVAQRYTQEEGIDYDEVFAPAARIEAIRLLLACASFKDFMVYQMDVKSDFLYGKIEEEVYVCQLPGFEDPYFPDRVYKVEKALYELHQAPRAWYETLSTYLLDNGFQRQKIDKILFIKRHKGDILLIQVYVDDIIFSLTKKELCFAFKRLMHEKFQMSSMGELTFTEVKIASTSIETQKPLLKDEDGEEVDVHMYRSMIGSLMYLTSLRPDFTFAVCACARYQVNPKVSHLYAMKKIFRYLKGQTKLGLWYLKDSPFDLVAYTDSDYAIASLNRKSLTGGYQFLGCRLISWQCKKQTVVANSTTEAEYVAASSIINTAIIVNIAMACVFLFWSTLMAKTINGEAQLHAKVDGKKLIVTESCVRRDLRLEDEEGIDCLPNSTIFKQNALMGNPTRKDTRVPQPSGLTKSVADEVVHKELGDRLVRAATTASSLEAVQDSGNITKTQSKATPNEPSSQGTNLGSGPRCQETMGDTIAQTRFERVSKHSNDLPLGRRIDDIDADEEITLVSVHDEVVSNDTDKEMFDVDDLGGEEVFVAGQNENVVEEVVDDIQVKGIVFQEPGKSTTTTKNSQQSQDKGKGIMIKETVNPKKKDQIRLDKEAAKKLQAEFDEEERLAREKDKKEERANIALIETWDDIQAKIDPDH
nr:putative ribonuclease H-like domain-containing protein [Tanacetum cinerariifolium]